MIVRVDLAGVARGDHGTISVGDHRTYREGGPGREAHLRELDCLLEMFTVGDQSRFGHRAPPPRQAT